MRVANINQTRTLCYLQFVAVNRDFDKFSGHSNYDLSFYPPKSEHSLIAGCFYNLVRVLLPVKAAPTRITVACERLQTDLFDPFIPLFGVGTCQCARQRAPIVFFIFEANPNNLHGILLCAFCQRHETPLEIFGEAFYGGLYGPGRRVSKRAKRLAFNVVTQV